MYKGSEVMGVGSTSNPISQQRVDSVQVFILNSRSPKNDRTMTLYRMSLEYKYINLLVSICTVYRHTDTNTDTDPVFTQKPQLLTYLLNLSWQLILV